MKSALYVFVEDKEFVHVVSKRRQNQKKEALVENEERGATNEGEQQ